MTELPVGRSGRVHQGFAKDRRGRLRCVEGHEQLLISAAQTEADNQAY